MSEVPLHLAHKQTSAPKLYSRPMPRALWGSWEVLYVLQLQFPAPWVPVLRLQGYLAHKKLLPPRTLQ